MTGISDRLIIGYDLCGDDVACLVVGRKQGRGINIINRFYGRDAEDMYEKLSEWGKITKRSKGDHH